VSWLGDFRRALGAERLKIRRTLALWLVSVLPAAPAGLLLLLFLTGNNEAPGQVDPWLWLGYGVMLMWAMAVLPLFIALETGLVAGIEHGADGWKHLFALPVRRGPVFCAKIVMAAALVMAAHAMLCFWTFIAGVVMAAFRPDLGFTLVPPLELFVFAAASFTGSWLMLSIHAWISLRWSSLVLNMGIAIMALVVNLSLVDSDLRRYYPWFIPAELTNGIIKQLLEQATLAVPENALASVLTSLLGGTLVVLAAVVMLGRRDVY
jgi:hypothetical protein